MDFIRSKFFKKSKEQCYFLIVGVSIDENIENYKNTTPTIPFKDKAEIVKAIKYVDQIVPQEHIDKYEAWEILRYNAIFHGDDWKS